jgi:hypothetical protein
MRTISREQAIAAIRGEILKLVDDDHSMCEVAARRGVYCHGFAQWDDEQLRERYAWIVKKRDLKSREELEAMANRWQLARQFVQNAELSCDVQQKDRDTCTGWDGFTNPTLERFHRELLGETVRVRDSASGAG